MEEKSIYYITVYAFLLSGGESSAQADRIFLVLYRIWYADLTFYYEQCVCCPADRRTISDRIPVVLHLNKKRS